MKKLGVVLISVTLIALMASAVFAQTIDEKQNGILRKAGKSFKKMKEKQSDLEKKYNTLQAEVDALKGTDLDTLYVGMFDTQQKAIWKAVLSGNGMDPDEAEKFVENLAAKVKAEFRISASKGFLEARKATEAFTEKSAELFEFNKALFDDATLRSQMERDSLFGKIPHHPVTYNLLNGPTKIRIPDGTLATEGHVKEFVATLQGILDEALAKQNREVEEALATQKKETGKAMEYMVDVALTVGGGDIDSDDHVLKALRVIYGDDWLR